MAPIRIAALLSTAILALAQTPLSLRARLSPVSMDAAMKANISGIGKATAELTGNILKIDGSFSGLLSPATTAQVRSGSATGVRGPVLFDLQVATATEGALSGTLTLNADQAEACRKGRFYIQIASQKAPDGNLWGWLLP